MKDEIERWKTATGLSSISMGDKDCIQYAMDVEGVELTTLNVIQLDEVLSILANYHIFLASEMGTLFARVKYLEANGPSGDLNLQRAKLNMVKPVHDAIKVKIDVLKKIYDRHVREAKWREDASSSRS